jgi:hypothetical protein
VPYIPAKDALEIATRDDEDEVLTAAVLFPNLSGPDIESIILVGVGLGLVIGGDLIVQSRQRRATTLASGQASLAGGDLVLRRENWRMASLALLERPVMSRQRMIGMLTLRGYLLFAFALVIVKVVEVAIGK